MVFATRFNFKFKLALASCVTSLLLACGGGGSSTTTTSTLIPGTNVISPVVTTPTPVVTTPTPVVVTPTVIRPTTAQACYSLTNGNAYKIRSTSSPTSSAVSATSTLAYFYTQDLVNVTLQTTTYNLNPVQSRVETGTGTYIGALNLTAIALDRLDFFYNTVGNKFNLIATRRTPAVGATRDQIHNGNGLSPTQTVGSSITLSYTYSNVGSTTTITATSTISLLAVEDVVTAAGTIVNACKFSVVEQYPVIVTSAQNYFVSSKTQWIAPGWGTVKEITVYNYTDGRIPATVTRTSVLDTILQGKL